MAALPNATIIGFTGAPVAQTAQGQGTFDKYSIAESIDDETTLPIKHVMAPSEMTVPAERLDKEFFALAEADSSADDRIAKVASFVAEYFREGMQKRVGLFVDFVGVLRELKRALKFDSEDVSGVIEDLDSRM